MKHIHYSDVEAKAVGDEAPGVSMRWLVSKDDGAPNFGMRHFTVEPGGHTPQHTHAWEHEVFVLGGSGAVWCEGDERALGPGDAVYMPPNAEHFFRNTGGEPFTFLCLVPN